MLLLTREQLSSITTSNNNRRHVLALLSLEFLFVITSGFQYQVPLLCVPACIPPNRRDIPRQRSRSQLYALSPDDIQQAAAAAPAVAETTTATTTLPSTQTVLTQLAIAGTLGVATDPLVEQFFTSNPQLLARDVQLKTTFVYGAADSLSNAARVYFVMTLLDYLTTLFDFHSSFLPSNLGQAAPSIAFTIWFTLTISKAKQTFFLQKVSGNRLGRVRLYDNLINFVLVIITSAVILDELDFDIGMGLQSVFAASGIGALVFSLAIKDLAEQITGGIILQAWDAFKVGEDVRLGDGTEGTIQKIGLVETEIAGYDNIVTKIPNSSIVNQRVSNISRTTQSQVKQILRFSYNDIDKIPLVLNDLKTEIQSSCPKLITDGSKPFAAILTQYEADHIQTLVNCHFNIQPFSLEYNENKEQVLLAIARAASKNNVKFAIPSIYYVNNQVPDNAASDSSKSTSSPHD